VAAFLALPASSMLVVSSAKAGAAPMTGKAPSYSCTLTLKGLTVGDWTRYDKDHMAPLLYRHCLSFYTYLCLSLASSGTVRNINSRSIKT
jgi:hypothetical protein